MASIERHHGSYRVVWREAGVKKSKGGFARKSDAWAFKVDIERRALLGELYQVKPVTFGEFAGLVLIEGRVAIDGNGPGTWFGRYKRTVRPSSYKRRTDEVRHLEELLPLTFDRVTAPVLAELFNRVGYDSPKTGVIVAQTVKMILRDARLHGQRVSEAAFAVRAPTYAPGPKVFLTLAEVEQVARTAADPHMANIVRFAFYTGLRQHECFDLTDNAVAPKERSVVVRSSKTDGGRRTVPLIAAAQTIVRAQRKLRTGQRAGSPYVFSAPRGGRGRVENFNDDYRALRKRLPVGHPLRYVPPSPARRADENARNPFHALRHSFASHMIAAGVQPKVLQSLMGHKSIQVTLDTYGHLFPGADDAAMEQFAAFLRGRRTSNPRFS